MAIIKHVDPLVFVFRDPKTGKGRVVYDWKRRCWVEPATARGWRYVEYTRTWICRSLAFIDGRAAT